MDFRPPQTLFNTGFVAKDPGRKLGFRSVRAAGNLPPNKHFFSEALGLKGLLSSPEKGLDTLKRPERRGVGAKRSFEHRFCPER